MKYSGEQINKAGEKLRRDDIFENESESSAVLEVISYIQHYWATALEIVDLFTDQALKSNQGDREWSVFFEKVSEHFAVMDSIHLFETMSRTARLGAYRQRLRADIKLAESAKIVAKCAKNLRVQAKLEAFAGSLVFVDGELNKSNASGFVLLQIDIEKKSLTADVFPPRGSREAEAAYIAIESLTAKREGVVAALVSTTAVGGIKEAYPNYFADSSRFDQLLQLIIDAS